MSFVVCWGSLFGLCDPGVEKMVISCLGFLNASRVFGVATQYVGGDTRPRDLFPVLIENPPLSIGPMIYYEIP